MGRMPCARRIPRLVPALVVCAALAALFTRCSFERRPATLVLRFDAGRAASGASAYACGFVAVSGPGVFSNAAPGAYGAGEACFGGSLVSAVAPYAGFATGVPVAVPAGSDRAISVFGVKSQAACDASRSAAELVSSGLSSLYLLGGTTAATLRDGAIHVPATQLPSVVDFKTCAGGSIPPPPGPGKDPLATGWGTSGNGYTLLGWGTMDDEAVAIAKQSSGKLVVAGTSQVSSSRHLAMLSRLNTDGTIDKTFGTAGTGHVTLDFGVGTNTAGTFADTLLVLSDDSILVGAGVFPNSVRLLGIAKVDKNGNLDTSFGVNGYHTAVIVISPTTDIYQKSLAIDSNNAIVSAGYADTRSSSAIEALLARTTSGGAVDSTFNTTGWTSFGAGGQVPRIAGVIFTGGYLRAWGSAPEIYNQQSESVYNDISASGSSTGASFLQPLGTAGRMNALIAQPQAIGGPRPVLAGSSGATTTTLTVLRYDLTGIADPSFGSNGIVSLSLGTSSTDVAEAMTTDASGAIYLAGSSLTTSDDYVVVGLTPAGQLNTAFGTNGVIHFLPKGFVQGHGMGITLGPDPATQVVTAGWLDSGRHEAVVALFKR